MTYIHLECFFVMCAKLIQLWVLRKAMKEHNSARNELAVEGEVMVEVAKNKKVERKAKIVEGYKRQQTLAQVHGANPLALVAKSLAFKSGFRSQVAGSQSKIVKSQIGNPIGGSAIMKTLPTEVQESVPSFSEEKCLDQQKYNLTYESVNREIERQIKLKPNNIDENGISLANQYNYIVIQIAVCCFFAPLYPCSFGFSWLMVMFLFDNESNSLVYEMRRSDPESGYTIGHWKTVLYILSWMLPLTGSFMLTVHHAPEWNTLAKFVANMAVIGVVFFLKGIVIDQAWYGASPLKINLLNRRRNFVITGLLSQVGGGVNEDPNNTYNALNSEIAGLPGKDKPRPRKMKN